MKIDTDEFWSKAFAAVSSELTALAGTAPQERLPKEEQIRSCLYRLLLDVGADSVAIERGYRDVDLGSGAQEADLVAFWRGRQAWVEIKRGEADAPTYNSKTAESMRRWLDDAKKLTGAPRDATKVFVLVGLRSGRVGSLYSDDHLASFAEAFRGLFVGHAVSAHAQASRLTWRDLVDAELLMRAWVAVPFASDGV